MTVLLASIKMSKGQQLNKEAILIVGRLSMLVLMLLLCCAIQTKILKIC